MSDFAVGELHGCGVSQGTVYCWGANTAQALCTGLPDSEQEPRLAPPSNDARGQQISVSRSNTCARMTDGTVQCCGDDRHGQLGRGDSGAPRSAFRPVISLADHVVHVVTSDGSACALVQGGAVKCWGSNEYGELGGQTRDGLRHPQPSQVTFR
ncbi:RCC1 domain-containing protein [Labilithrix luteola]|uniref:RCC1 domain-containing protein n=1 Tax=Labilithrix luteola TaxID=1391654 RepID=UPI001473D35D|nr:hypothetical protein [Labilithrix luteola]